MKITKIEHVDLGKSDAVENVNDCNVEMGYLQGPSGSLPDVDVDYQSDKRQEVKAYTEQRYNHDGKQRVLSAGTFTTLKAKAVIKDVARTMRLPIATVNYLTAMIEDDNADWTELFRMAKTNPRLYDLMERFPKLFEDIRPLMGSPRSSSIHASALLITPDEKDGNDYECFDFIPIKKEGNLLVSENTGVELDELGLLKNDCLATKELSILREKCELVNSAYGTHFNFDKLMLMEPNDPEVFEMLSVGATQSVFQFSSKGITGMLKDLKPTCIEDLIAANALYRPATLDAGSVDDYINRKNGLVEPTYYWGTEDILKETYGIMVYQEELSKVAQVVGKFSVSHSIQLVKYISKKKKDKIRASRKEFMDGAISQGCPEEDANAIWDVMEAAGRYCFNKSHSTAYALTAYWGAWLKCKYPTATYTVALKWANDDKELQAIMSEMDQYSRAKLVPPDINRSNLDFTADFVKDEILWSLTRIKMCTAKSMGWVLDEREKNGPFESIEQFIDRIFKYKLKMYRYWDDPDNEDEVRRCPVNARHILNLIMAGAFDVLENVTDTTDRYLIIDRAAKKLGIELKESDFPVDLISKHYFWSQQQQRVSGLGAIDYRKVFDNSKLKPNVKGKCSYRTLNEILDKKFEGRKVAVCCTVADVVIKKYESHKTGRKENFAKLTLQQGLDISEVVVWSEEYMALKDAIDSSKDKIVCFTASVKYDEYSKMNKLQFTRTTLFEII